jgi:hypothetical protein
MKEMIKWSNIFHKHEQGESIISIPFHELMVGSEKEVTLDVTELPSENNCKIKSI